MAWIWISVCVSTLVVITLLKYLTPRYLSYLLDTMAYKPQREIEYVLDNEEPPEEWHGRYRRKMKSLIRFMRDSRWVDESDERRKEIIEELEELCARWDAERRK